MKFEVFEFNAFVEDKDGTRNRFYLHISTPVRTEGEDDYYCAIYAPTLLNGQKRIFRVDKAQARELSLSFVFQLIEGKRLCDEDGNEIRLV